MIKLKKLIKESTWVNRKFGEPLPTMADYKKAHEGKLASEGTLNEKKEIAPKPIQAIGVLTQRNQHNVARAMVAKGMLNNKKLYDAYMKIDDLADFFGSLPPELSQLRNKMDEKYLKKGLAKMYSNWQELWSEL